MRPFAPDLTTDALQHLAARGLSDACGARPLLLRVLTDLFVMRPTHSPEGVQQFREIAHRVIEDASLAEIDHAASALCNHPRAPAEVLDRLAARESAGARLLLADCRRLSLSAVKTAATDGALEAALAVARRVDLDPATLALLAARPEIEVARALAGNESAPLNPDILPGLVARARNDAELAMQLTARAPHRHEVLPLFLTATSRQRAVMLARARQSLGEEDNLSLALEHGPLLALRRIEALALDGDREDFAAALAEACGCDEDMAGAIIADTRGEPLAIALRALGLAPEILTRIFLFVDPQISHSYRKVAALTRLSGSLSQQVARRILDAICQRQIPRMRHVPLHDQTARFSVGRPNLAKPLAEGRSTRAPSERLHARQA